MQEQLISFETAKLAKEKGFNEKSQYYYILDFGSFQRNTEPLKFNTSLESENIYQSCKLSGSQPHLALAPTQSLLQKWLREVYKTHITIYSKSQESWMYRVTFKGQSLEEGLYGEDFEDYEEALEAGLQETLKLIK